LFVSPDLFVILNEVKNPRISSLLVLSLALPGLLASFAQDPAPTVPTSTRPHVAFTFERKGLPVPRYQFTVNDDGTGVYQGEAVVDAVGGYTTSADRPPQPFTNHVTISQPTVTRIFKLSEQLNHFNKTCASKAKNIADTGTKSLIYAGPDGSGSCTYNYTEIKEVQSLTEIFQGIAETMDQGRRLDQLHRYDRLGLDEAITIFSQEVTEGRALEVGTIAACLHSIASDADVMARVRARATTLLALIPTDTH
jgi:hypothetical protein